MTSLVLTDLLCGYNALPNIRDQPALQDEHVIHVKALLEIIQDYGMAKVFGIHSLHSHGALPVGTVRLESGMGNGFTWTKPTAVEKLDIANVHTTFFKFGDESVVPFEFAEGPSPIDVSKIPAEFISNIGSYLVEHDLTNVIALEVGNFAKGDGVDAKPTAELEIQWGQDIHFTVVVPTAILKPGAGELIGTGWTVPVAGAPGAIKPDGEPDPGTHWLKVERPKYTHKVYVGSTEPVTPELLVQKLGEQGIIVV